MSTVKDQLIAKLTEISAAFRTLQGIETWTLGTLFKNLGTILQAAKDAFLALEDLKSLGTTFLDDATAQKEVAQLLDDAIKLNAILEPFDGMVLEILIPTICAFIKKQLEEQKAAVAAAVAATETAKA